ncbi:MAG TPA: ATP-binding protein [Planctomycetota bacterium]|nr:ATP-binding protein [Planctomycetota bacterium]
MLAATLFAMALEPRAAHTQTAGPLPVGARAAHRDGQRDAAAQLVSLEMSYERMRSVLEALAEGVLVVDSAGEIVLANPAAQRAMKVPGQDPAGQLLWDALKPELAPRARDAWETLHRDTPHGALPQIRHAGVPCRDRVYDLTAVGVTSARTGHNFGTVLLLVDSTRAHELQRLKDRFLSNVSHELRTPLTNICAFAEILDALVPKDHPELTEFAQVIHHEGLQLKGLMDQMFDYLQLESGEAVFASEEVDARALVRVLGEQSALAARARAIGLEIAIDDGAPHVRADRGRLEQVVRSLLDNAVKFTPPGGRIRITCSGRDGCWELRVEDSGPGVPAEDRHAVFEKFHQLSDSLSEKPAGTGLGLATSHVIVVRFGGLIWCEEAPGGGACFVVVLPGFGRPPLLGAAAAAAVAASSATASMT